MLPLTGTTALVTGASSGIGAAVADALAGQGARVIVHFGTNEDGARQVHERLPEVSGGEHVLAQADLGRPDGPERLAAIVDDVGELGILVNNAGSLIGRSATPDIEDGRVRAIVDLNFTSVALLTKRLLPRLVASSGAVVNVSSVAAYNGGGGGSAMYGAAKGAIVSLTRALAKEVAPQGVRVNAICPGVIGTPFHERFSDDAMMASMLATIPMGRAGTARECADAVTFLVGPGSSYITGQVLHVNGGQYFG